MIEKKYPVWLDVDTGVDDAAALLTASRLEQLDIRGISAVAGNVELERTFANTRKVCKLAGLPVPVYRGADKPLFRPLCTAAHVHGLDGLGGAELPEDTSPAETLPAWDALYREAVRQQGELQLIAVGPLTNLAIAFAKYPDLPALLKRILIMGGSSKEGNDTPAAEFNIYVDPHAAQSVFKCGAPLVMCGLDVTMQAMLMPEEIDAIGRSGPIGRFFRESTRRALAFHQANGTPGMCLHDVCPVLYVTHPHLFQGQEAGVYVETQGTVTLGKTVTDLWSDFQFPKKNAFVVLDVDRDAFASLVSDLLTSG